MTYPAAPLRSTVLDRPQPLGAARWLLILFAAFLVLQVLLGPGFHLLDVVFPQSLEGVARQTLLIVLAIVTMVAALGALATGLASLILSIIVVVKARGPLRRGGVMVLVAVLISTLFSFDVSGDISSAPEAIQALVGVLGIVVMVFTVLVWLFSAIAWAFLLQGRRAAARHG